MYRTLRRNPSDGTFSTSVAGVTGAVAVTPSDTVDLTTGATKGIYVGVAGDVTAIMTDGTTATFKTLAAGVVHLLSIKRIKATGTAATSILALY